jgi:hypothetical protein
MNDESIFQGKGDWRYTAGVNYPHDSHELMTEGYRRAAQRLVDSLAADPTGMDFVVYAIVYLYRHWFELRLKIIIDLGRQLLQEGDGYPKGHSLHTLWPVARTLTQKICQDERAC